MDGTSTRIESSVRTARPERAHAARRRAAGWDASRTRRPVVVTDLRARRAASAVAQRRIARWVEERERVTAPDRPVAAELIRVAVFIILAVLVIAALPVLVSLAAYGW
jgi:ABC-type anion transport system duplicated permease subunit